jgi:hypothetical protein
MLRSFFVLLLATASTASAQQVLPPRVRAAADRISAAQLERDLHYLSSDALKGRDTFSPGFDTAANYIVERLKRAGLEPFGDHGTYFQYYDVVSQTVDTSSYFVEIDGKRLTHGDILLEAGETMPLTVTAPMVYVGHGFRIPSRGVDPYAGIDLKGKVLVMRISRPPQLKAGEQLPPDAEPAFRIARRMGAAAVIAIASTRMMERWDDLRASPSPFRNLQPDVRSAYSTAGEPAFIYAKPGTIDTLRLGNITIHAPLGKREMLRTYNVVARIRGSDARRRDEYVTIAAHLDGAVSTVAEDGDSIYNAADDNASGSAGILAIAEQMKQLPAPKRSVVFIWDSGEEVGLYGTRSFVGRKILDPGKIVAHFNIDMIGASRRPGTADSASMNVAEPNEVFVGGPRVLSSAVDSLIHQVNRAYLGMHINQKHDTAASEFFYPRTDAGPFLERGVLAIDFFTGLHPRYHGAEDEAEHLDPQKIEAVSRTAFAIIYAIADADRAPVMDKPMPSTVPRYD